MKSVCVLMSTYNGEKFICSQVDSILMQKNVNVDIYIRDDGSKDSTVNLLKQYFHKDKRVNVVSGDKNVGFIKSYYKLMHYALNKLKRYDYYAFSDQDDIWLDNKLYIATKYINTYDGKLPCLYYSNLKVVDQDLNYVHERYRAGYVKNTKQQILAEICVYGCTCVFNYAALTEMCKVRIPLISHDNWIAWVSAFLGNIYYDENSYILYRQHGNNVSGGVKKGSSYIFDQIKKLGVIKTMKPDYELRARLFLDIYGDMISQSDRRLLEMLSNYRHSTRYKIILLLGRKISSGHLIKEAARKVRIVKNVL